MHKRGVLIGMSAWLLGAGTATGGCMLAVNELGHSLAPSTSQQLTVSAVQAANASEQAEPSSPGSATRSPSSSPAQTSAAPAQGPTRESAPSPRTSTPSPTQAGTLLTSSGGNVVASCTGAGAYLDSWSPQQGYEADHVVRGPASTAEAVFVSSHYSVIMRVTCTGGIPAAAVSTSSGSGGGDN